MIVKVAEKLEQWIKKENYRRAESGALTLRKCEIMVIGQTALLEAKMGIQLAATMDVDLYRQLHGEVRTQLEKLLLENGKQLDPVGHEAWMPQETKFTPLYEGTLVTASIAKPEYVLISKAKVALEKNRVLLIEYLGNKPSKLFLELAKKYQINLESILTDG